ncbi:trehalose phosphorylase [Tuber brumale]|nr:trehalose phosphorylase [Tuber brumale]
MDDSEAPHAVTNPLDIALSQNGKTEETVWGEIPLVPLYLGMAATRINNKTVKIGVSIHDGLYTKDYCTNELTLSDAENMRDVVMENTIHTIVAYSSSNGAKFVGAGVTLGLEQICPGICAHIWKTLDIVCIVLMGQATQWGTRTHGDTPMDVDEQADSAARECVRCFGHDHNPALAICFRNKVMPDAEGAIRLIENLQEYKDTVHESTWKTVVTYAYELRGYKNGRNNGDPQSAPIKIAFFSATPQGGGVALMRHALLRFCSELGVDMSWYIPEPDSEAFRVTKTNHNILQGVAHPEARFGAEGQAILEKWMSKNAERYWLSPGGPLAPGGAGVVIIDDPQMPALIPLIKKARPEVKIIYRSHIEVRKDLVEIPGSPQRQVWEWIWNHVNKADVFISHPVSTFVPYGVPLGMVGLMPACTDWLDGLNKPLGEWDLRFYHHNLHNLCNERKMNHLLYPKRDYITQIARFDPSKGIPDVIESYRKLRVRLRTDAPERLPPQLLICGHGAIDDPDAEIVYNQTIALLRQWRYVAIAKDVIVVRIGPSDQMLNAMITTAKIVMQLSLREGFEVKVSEALYHGKPVVATRAGGIPLQVEDGKSGFLVEVGDTDTVANRLFDLYTNDDLYARMSKYAKASVSDEVGTVGNAACWLYLAAKLARGHGLEPNTGWIMDMARAEAGQKCRTGGPTLSRAGIDFEGRDE